MDQNQMQAVLAGGQAELMREQIRFQIEQQATDVTDLRCQINDRLDRLQHLLDDVKRAVNEDREVFRYQHGAFGNDTDTVDTLLAALGQAVGNLTEIKAKTATMERLGESTAEKLMSVVEAAGEGEGSENVVPLAPGQYL